MTFPLDGYTSLGLEVQLLLSLAIGVGFGFMLERGGFGSSRILAGIFYARDWRVLKVMFGAIVTAMLGLYAFQGAGLVAMDQVAFRTTYLWPQIAGGFLLGAGFVTAGYCPGTSVVGAVSGKLDALLVILGVIGGVLVFEELFPLLADFYSAGHLGDISLMDWLGIPTWAVVLIVTGMALGAFALVEWLDKRKSGAWPRYAKRGTGVVLAATALTAFVQFSGPGEARALIVEGNAETVNEVIPTELAAWIVEGRAEPVILDLRAAEATPDLPFAVRVNAEEIRNLRTRPDLLPEHTYILIDADGQGDSRETAASLVASGVRAMVLAGGADRWEQDVLSPEAGSPIAHAYRILISGESPFGGAAPPPPKKSKPLPLRKKKKKGGCS